MASPPPGPHGGVKQRRSDGEEQNRPKRCYICGEQNHLSENCPTKESGVKCFRCGERGHIVARCTEGISAVRDSCAVSGRCDEKFYKDVCINNRSVLAMIDTGSDMCLMRAGCHVKLNATPLRKNKIYFRGIGLNSNETLGEFDADVYIDNSVYFTKIQVVSDALMRHDLIIGADFLRTVEVSIKKSEILISKPREDPELPEVFQIDYAHEADKLNVVNFDDNCRNTLEYENVSCKPNKTRDIDTETKLIFKNYEPVYVE